MRRVPCVPTACAWWGLTTVCRVTSCLYLAGRRLQSLSHVRAGALHLLLATSSWMLCVGRRFTCITLHPLPLMSQPYVHIANFAQLLPA